MTNELVELQCKLFELHWELGELKYRATGRTTRLADRHCGSIDGKVDKMNAMDKINR